ncbi:hypothetical protein [Cupriavidus basilensis]|nr:hypothetical protein [Cupriavidus basilensis]MCP3018782.1 hypothetical protein [Cupriavidus basilensis]
MARSDNRDSLAPAYPATLEKQTPEGLHSWLKTESDKWQPVLRTMKVEAD